ncbi:hypothetical protein JL721_7048 [Aureococcus anophagefferens]|nr:hypothetical protein JL721_7048 [Aureococcus anophagefferens]
MLERAIEIEPALRMTLKKTHADLRGDEIIDGELDEAAVEETASIVSSGDEDSSSSDDDDDERPKLSKKKAMDEAKLMKRTPTPAQWNLARQMLPVLLKVKEFNKLVQYSTVPTTDRTLPMARQLLRSSRRSPGPCTWKKNSDGVYSKTFVQIESRICSRRRAKTKLSEVESNRTKRSKGEKSLLDQAFDDLDGSSDDDASMDVDACEMTLYTSKLRKALQGKVIAPMLRCKANHDLFFEEIKAKIYERYFRKYRNNVDAFPTGARLKDDADDDVAN